MKILYLSYSAIPSNMASSLQVMKMCNAFAHNGHKVLLLAPERPDIQQKDIEDVYKFYDVKNLFDIKRVKFMDKLLSSIFSKKIVYSITIIKDIKTYNPDLVYGRLIIGCFVAAFMGYNVILELHNKVPSRFDRFLLKILKKSKKLKKLVAVTNTLRQYCMDNLKINEQKIYVIPSGTDEVVNFDEKIDLKKREALQVGYVGNLYKGKGVEIIISLAEKLPKVDFHIVGGTEKDISFWKAQCNLPNIYFHGFVPPYDLHKYINAFDICLLPNQKVVFGSIQDKKNPKANIGDITSPLKMFQYMAHKKPIIASDLPVLREILNEKNAFLVPPDDINAWIKAIKLLKDNNDLRKTIANNAYQDFINNYTWIQRAEKVIL